MTAISIETTVSSKRFLNIKLPADFPAGLVKVTVEDINQEKAIPQMELGKRLLEIRQQAIANGMELKSTDEILAEIYADRE
ncbi:hypothetical protein TI05_07505 [Achromatium sp. WMS3]|nr:hypothetical protein TI05_07505 [Achromatium sp. WMS3]